MGRFSKSNLLDGGGLPFRLDRASADSLSSQLTAGLREAIHSGVYRPGDALPPMPAMAASLSVSEIVVRSAYRRLAEEGLVIARPRLGTTVLPAKSPVWRGHVLCVMCDHDFNYQLSVGVEKMRSLLTKNGYLFSQVTVLENADSTIDCSGLDVALSRPVDFVILFYDRPNVARRLLSAGVPFVVVGGTGEAPPGCVGRIGDSMKRAVDDLVRHCRKARLSRVEVISCSRFDNLELQTAKLLRRYDIMVKRTVLPHDETTNRCESAMRAGLDFVEHNLAKRGFRLPDLYFVTDDWVASGMLAAFLSHGVRLPEDVRFVCYTNRGFGPIYPKPLALIARDPFKRGDEISRRIYDYLVRHRPFPGGYIECEYIPGETFP